jgi:hypothetical protein
MKCRGPFKPFNRVAPFKSFKSFAETGAVQRSKKNNEGKNNG